ncbi:MAG: hypothetical protein KatS3mg002_0439 [Candidatus Woesearchaeota archaeon]|nr:MAG: hypothetical protein KatS3mg002_0439 [Candidatus Woesearchaeota archaeon]
MSEVSTAKTLEHRLKKFIKSIIETTDPLNINLETFTNIFKLVETNQYIELDDIKLFLYKKDNDILTFIIMSPIKMKRKILDILRDIYYTLFDIEQYEVIIKDKFIFLYFYIPTSKLKEITNGE